MDGVVVVIVVLETEKGVSNCGVRTLDFGHGYTSREIILTRQSERSETRNTLSSLVFGGTGTEAERNTKIQSPNTKEISNTKFEEPL